MKRKIALLIVLLVSKLFCHTVLIGLLIIGLLIASRMHAPDLLSRVVWFFLHMNTVVFGWSEVITDELQ